MNKGIIDMKKCLKFLFFLMLMPIVFCGGASAQLSDSVKTGKDKNGEYVIPKTLAGECDVSIGDSSAATKMEDCFHRLMKDRDENPDENSRINELWEDVINESMKGSLVIALQTKMYAADYEEDVVDGFIKNMSESSSLGEVGGGASGGASGGEAGGAEAAGVREDWQNIGVSDAHIAAYVNSWLNKFMASTIMHKALTEIKGMNKSYLEE